MKIQLNKATVICASVFFTATMISSCNKNSESFSNENNTSVSPTGNDNVIRIIEELENPYSVSNMRKAYASLQQEGLLKASMEIEPTHLYVRFLPKDSIENEILLTDTSLTLFPYPLDCKLTEGNVFIDQTLKGGTQFIWLYTKVPVGYVSPISGYEIIEELFLLANDSNNDTQLKSMSISFLDWDLLENRSLQLTGNVNENLEQAQLKASKFYPSATIRVYDDVLNKQIPVPGVKVRARNWFNWETAITNEQGYAKMSDNFKNTDYSIAWENSEWDIRDGALFQAIYKGPNESKNSHWAFDIPKSKKETFAHAHVTRACYAMLRKNAEGLGTSSDERTRLAMKDVLPLKIAVRDKNGTGINYGNNWLGFLPEIQIYIKENGNDKLSDVLFATTVHEITHSLHIHEFAFGLAQFAFVDKIIRESWPDAVEWKVTTAEYARLGFTGWGDKHPLLGQEWGLLRTDYSKGSENDMAYSPLFIDLMDSFNQRGKDFNLSKYEYPNDNVSGFTPTELRNILKKVYNLKDLKQQVKALRSDQTIKNNIDILFATYEKYKK